MSADLSYKRVSIAASIWLLLASVSLNTQASESLTICARSDGPPKHYVDDSGQARGYAIDIAVAVVEEAGFNPLVRNYPWKRAQDEALKGNCVITGFSKTQQRTVDYLFSVPLHVDQVLLWTRAGERDAYSSYKDLVGKRVGIALGSRYSGEFEDNRPNLNLVEVANSSRLLRLLARERIDAAIISGDIASVNYLTQQEGLYRSMFEISNMTIALDPNHLGVPRNLKNQDSESMVERLDKAIKTLKDDGRIGDILTNYR